MYLLLYMATVSVASNSSFSLFFVVFLFVCCFLGRPMWSLGIRKGPLQPPFVVSVDC